jgi:lipase chaperone LimK
MQVRQWTRPGLLAVVIGLLAYALIWFCSSEPAVPASSMQPSVPATRPDRFDLGQWSGTVAENASTTADTSPPEGLEAGADQHLRINRALRDVFDYYLLSGLPGSRAEHLAQLLAHLKAGLPALAYADAEPIAYSYVAYLAAHDALLARQSVPVVTLDSKLAAPDAERMAAWLSQLSRLRQNMLGVEVARVWYADEEAESQRTLAALRSGAKIILSAGAADPAQKGFDDLRLLRQQGASEQVQRDMMEQQFGAAAAKRFDRLEQEELAWQERYAQYRQAADQIRRQAGSAEVDRTQQIDSLRTQAFSNDAERMRAQALDRR